MNFYTKKTPPKQQVEQAASVQQVPCNSPVPEAKAVSSPSRCRGNHQEENGPDSEMPHPNDGVPVSVTNFYAKSAAIAQANKLARQERSEARRLERRAASAQSSQEDGFIIPQALGPASDLFVSPQERTASSSAPWGFYQHERERVAAKRARKSEKSGQPSDWDGLLDAATLMPTDEPWNAILTQDSLRDIVLCLPSWIRFHPWRLVYSPKVHGVSIRTFFRQQSGPNVVLVRDAQGHVFGGFAAQEWFPTTHGYGEIHSFVFTVGSSSPDGDSEPPHSAKSLGSEEQVSGKSPQSPQDPHSPCLSETSTKDSTFHFFPCTSESGGIIQWSCDEMIALGSALVIKNDFLNGSSTACSMFKSPPLSRLGVDFIISDFECWAIGEQK